jgi:hypothetical protein
MSPSLATTSLAGAGDPYLQQLVHLVADHGITSFESDVARLVVRLRARGIHSPLATLLADHAASPVVRERALGELLCRLEAVEAATTERVEQADRSAVCSAA